MNLIKLEKENSRKSGGEPGTPGDARKTDGACREALRVFLMVENRLLREALARIFRKHDDLEVAGSESKKSCTALEVRDSNCDVVVFDFFDAQWLQLIGSGSLPDRQAPRFLLVGMSAEFEPFLEAVQAGVTGYLLQEASTAEVLSAVRTIALGSAICPPAFCGRLFQYISSSSKCASVPSGPARQRLTIRQRHLTSLVAKGWTNKEIATHLNLSEFTVRNHLYRIMRQVGATSRRQAVDRILFHR